MFRELMRQFFASYTENGFALQALRELWNFSPLWMPPALIYVFWQEWKRYTFAFLMAKEKQVLLEIKLPQEINKTPLAMELVLIALHQTSGETTFIDRYWLGKRRTWFSLEMVSLGGQVHFFIWTRNLYRNQVETAIYSQYPGVEVHEVPDYASRVRYNKDTMAVWGVEFDLTKPDPYPIKTYIDYSLDKESTKEEVKSDPLTPLIEFLGSVHPTGQVWTQILIQSHKKDKLVRGRFFNKKVDWQREGEAEVDKILRRDPKTKAFLQDPGATYSRFPQLSKTEEAVAEAIQRSLAKPAFNVGIRSIYMSPPKDFNPVFIVGMLSCFKQFGSAALNGFRPARWHSIFDYPWQDFRRIRWNRFARLVIEYYKRRSYFHDPYKQRPGILNVEELATIFHFPGGVLATPTFGKIMSKKSEPPPNLPV